MSARLRAWFRNAPVTAASSEADADDGELVRRFADTHDEAAFAELVRRHGPMVLATCRRVLHPDVHTADDAFQATFLVLTLKAGAVSPPERVGAFLYGVAVHVAKKAKTWARKLAPSAPADLDRVPVMPFEADPDAADLKAKIDDVLAGLPSKYRAPVVLCDLEGRSRAEAATALGWSEGTLSGRLARARKLLADRLKRRGVALPAAGLGVLLPASAALATVPVQLAASTVRTAALVSTGAAAGAASEAIPASVAALAQGVSMHSATFKLLGIVLAGIGLILGGFGLYALTAADPPPPPDKPLFVAAPVPPAEGWGLQHTFTFKNPVTAVAFSRDLIAAGDKEGSLVLLDPKTGKQKDAVQDFEKGRGYGAATEAESIDLIRFDPFGEKVSVASDSGKSICRFEVEKKGREFPRYTNDDNLHLKALGLTPDGKYWLHSQNREEDKLYRLLITPNGLGDKDEAIGFIFTRKMGEFRFEHVSPIKFAAADSPSAVATVTRANGRPPMLRFWSKASEKPLWEVDLNSWTTHYMNITGVLVAPGGRQVALTGDSHGGGGRVWLFDAKTGKRTVELDGFKGVVRAAAYSPDGRQLAAGCDDKTVRIHDTESGKELAVLKGHTEAVTSVAFSPGGNMIVTGSNDKTAKVWSVKTAAKAPIPANADKGWVTKRTFTHQHPISALAFAPDLVAAGDESGVLNLWDTKTGTRKKLPDVGMGRFKPIIRAQFLPNRVLRLVTGWTDEPRDRYYLDYPLPSPEKEQIIHSNCEFGATTNGAFSFGSDNDNRDLTLWPIDPDAGKKGGVTVQARFRHESVVEHAAGSDENTVATITNSRSSPVLRLWSKDTGKPLWEVDLWRKIANIDVTGVQVSPGGKLVAVTGDAGQVWVFDAKTGKLVSKTNKDTGAVGAAAYSPDGRQLVAGCADKTARVYDTETGEELGVLRGHTEAVTAVAFSPDGKQIVTGSADKTVRVWEFNAALPAPKPAPAADNGAEKKDVAEPTFTALGQVTDVDLEKHGVAVRLIRMDGGVAIYSYPVAKNAEIILANGKKGTLNDLKDALVGQDKGLGTETVIDKTESVVRSIRVFRDQEEFEKRFKKAAENQKKVKF
jgi:RNA polymerase sigma factor (sigma-70 family)